MSAAFQWYQNVAKLKIEEISNRLKIIFEQNDIDMPSAVATELLHIETMLENHYGT